MDTPYINTQLYTSVTVHPNQLNNNLYLNIKKNLIKDLEKSCYKDYGFIQKIFSIIKYDEGRLQAENTIASVKYNVQFSCRICQPVNGIAITAKINGLNKAIVKLENGPINIIITNDRINDSVFFRDNNTGALGYKKDGHSHIIENNDFVKVKIIQNTFNHGDSLIVAIGYLDNICSDKDIEKYYEEINFGNDIDPVELDDENDVNHKEPLEPVEQVKPIKQDKPAKQDKSVDVIEEKTKKTKKISKKK